MEQSHASGSGHQSAGSRALIPAAVSGWILGMVGLYDPAKDLYYKCCVDGFEDVASVQIAEEQQGLWKKNAACFAGMAMKEVNLNHDVRVRTGACPTNDVLVQVYPKNKPAVSKWVSLEQISLSQMGSLIGTAYASSVLSTLDLGAQGDDALPVLRIQTQISTVCQGWENPTQPVRLIRVTNEGGKCFKEVTNVLSGRIEYREEAACNAKCDMPVKR